MLSIACGILCVFYLDRNSKMDIRFSLGTACMRVWFFVCSYFLGSFVDEFSENLL